MGWVRNVQPGLYTSCLTISIPGRERAVCSESRRLQTHLPKVSITYDTTSIQYRSHTKQRSDFPNSMSLSVMAPRDLYFESWKRPSHTLTQRGPTSTATYRTLAFQFSLDHLYQTSSSCLIIRSGHSDPIIHINRCKRLSRFHKIFTLFTSLEST